MAVGDKLVQLYNLDDEATRGPSGRSDMSKVTKQLVVVLGWGPGPPHCPTSLGSHPHIGEERPPFSG